MNEILKKDTALDDDYRVPYLPGDLPFDKEQKQWLGGFLAGLHSRLLVTEQNTAAATAVPVALKPVTIIYGSQTGNAEGVAELAAEQASNQGMAPQVLDMSDTTIAQLTSAERLLVVTSTYGEGEMPDNAQVLWDALSQDDAPSFTNTYFSVLALGDTSYDGFCVAGKLWDDRLVELGGTRIVDRVDCDVDFEALAQSWVDTTLPKIALKGTQSGSTEMASVASGIKKSKSKYNRQNPLTAQLITKRVLTEKASSKEIYHFEFSLGESGETYEAGDALNVIAQNRADLVAEVLAKLSATGDEQVKGFDRPLEHLLRQDFEIRTPSKNLVAEIATRADDATLQALLDNNDTAMLANFLWGKDVLDLLATYPQVQFSAEEFLSLSKPLMPRAYSISSSINCHESEVHLTIASVRYNAEGRDHNGVCSTFLSDVTAVGDKVLCYFSPNKSFSVPENKEAPVIMVGPGTGIAPFRAFLEEREVSEAKGENWLFFGDRNADTDFIYREQLQVWQASGVLNRLDLAFSRDQVEKIYVQDRMRDHGAELFDWLERGAYFYICGDAYRMAKDVDKALHDIVTLHGSMTDKEAASYVNVLKVQKRYIRDVY